MLNELMRMVLGGLAVVVTVGLGLHHQLLQRLREEHPEVFDSLGRPHLLRNNSIENGLMTLRFICGQGSRKLGDQRVLRMCFALRILYILNLLALLLGAAILLVMK